ncbi:MAG TPA: mandelate racemase/muconate lactonizing enzyme family protein [Burkholderiales bacterium]|nr:mandelate racemase/muconate lactonizing enzyme family protein [Burkholderiales bacterium]
MAVTIEKLECWVHRAPIATPLANAFAAMTNRPAVWVRVSARDGSWGWGEVFSNFPTVGAEHRARLVSSIFSPLLEGTALQNPAEMRSMLEKKTRIMAIQCGEPGPFAQIIGGIDQALWDLSARRAGEPLWKHLGGTQPKVRIYASGLGPDRVAEMAAAKKAAGYRAFKLKVGFGGARNRDNLAELRQAVGRDATVMVDANQAWSLEESIARIEELMPYAPQWIEEPMAADESIQTWMKLYERTKAPLAAGENIRGEADFAAALDAGYLRFVQPDVGKWGGITGCGAVARRAVARGIAFCPHWLAGGVGLAASMHLLAAVGGAGFAEVDANPNPLREEVFPMQVENGVVTLSSAPGLGVEPDLARLKPYAVSSGSSLK